MFLENFRRVVCQLALADRLEPRHFGGDVQPTDAGKEGEVGGFVFHVAAFILHLILSACLRAPRAE